MSLSEFQTNSGNFGYCVNWADSNFAAAYDAHKGEDEKIDAAEWQTLCLKLQNASYKPEEPLDLDNEVSQMFEEIWSMMHYNEPDELSRTLY